jgi:hypothetical protein
VTDAAVAELEPLTSASRACALLGKSRATLHRQRNPKPAAEKAPAAPRAAHPAALTADERASVLAELVLTGSLRAPRPGRAPADSFGLRSLSRSGKVGRLGLEPRTHGLKVRCSTIELTPQPGRAAGRTNRARRSRRSVYPEALGYRSTVVGR